MNPTSKPNGNVTQGPLRVNVLQEALGPSLFASHILYHEVVDSTNTLAKDLASQGAAEGTLLITEEQTQGRGRMGRQWFSPPYKNLLFSIILRPTLEAQEVFSLSHDLSLGGCGRGERHHRALSWHQVAQ